MGDHAVTLSIILQNPGRKTFGSLNKVRWKYLSADIILIGNEAIDKPTKECSGTHLVNKTNYSPSLSNALVIFPQLHELSLIVSTSNKSGAENKMAKEQNF